MSTAVVVMVMDLTTVMATILVADLIMEDLNRPHIDKVIIHIDTRIMLPGVQVVMDLSTATEAQEDAKALLWSTSIMVDK